MSLVALGSSSTIGAGASRPNETGWVALLSRALSRRLPGMVVHNLGRSGALLGDYLSSWPEVIASAPTVLVVLPFTDFARTPLDRFVHDFKALGEHARALATAAAAEDRRFHLFIGDLRIDPLYLEGAKREGPRYRLKDYVTLLEKNGALSDAVGSAPEITIVPVIDQNAIHPEWISADGHPNDLGHAYLAGCFVRAVEAWLDGKLIAEPRSPSESSGIFYEPPSEG